jgi:archaellum component FlaC
MSQDISIPDELRTHTWVNAYVQHSQTIIATLQHEKATLQHEKAVSDETIDASNQRIHDLELKLGVANATLEGARRARDQEILAVEGRIGQMRARIEDLARQANAVVDQDGNPVVGDMDDLNAQHRKVTARLFSYPIAVALKGALGRGIDERQLKLFCARAAIAADVHRPHKDRMTAATLTLEAVAELYAAADTTQRAKMEDTMPDNATNVIRSFIKGIERLLHDDLTELKRLRAFKGPLVSERERPPTLGMLLCRMMFYPAQRLELLTTVLPSLMPRELVPFVRAQMLTTDVDWQNEGACMAMIETLTKKAEEEIGPTVRRYMEVSLAAVPPQAYLQATAAHAAGIAAVAAAATAKGKGNGLKGVQDVKAEQDGRPKARGGRGRGRGSQGRGQGAPGRTQGN